MMNDNYDDNYDDYLNDETDDHQHNYNNDHNNDSDEDPKVMMMIMMIKTSYWTWSWWEIICDGFCDGLKPRIIILYLLILQCWWHKTYPECFWFMWFWNSRRVHCWERWLIGLQKQHSLAGFKLLSLSRLFDSKWLNWWQRWLCFWPEQSQGSLPLPQQDYPGWENRFRFLSNSALSFIFWNWSCNSLKVIPKTNDKGQLCELGANAIALPWEWINRNNWSIKQ